MSTIVPLQFREPARLTANVQRIGDVLPRLAFVDQLPGVFDLLGGQLGLAPESHASALRGLHGASRRRVTGGSFLERYVHFCVAAGLGRIDGCNDVFCNELHHGSLGMLKHHERDFASL